MQIALDEGGRDKAARLSDVVIESGTGTARSYSSTDRCDINFLSKMDLEGISEDTSNSFGKILRID